MQMFINGTMRKPLKLKIKNFHQRSKERTKKKPQNDKLIGKSASIHAKTCTDDENCSEIQDEFSFRPFPCQPNGNE